MIMTRREYLERNSTIADTYALHREYFKGIIDASGGPQRFQSLLPIRATPDHVRTCYAQDKHLNNIPLKFWDMQAMTACRLAITGLRAAEDTAPFCLGNGVCILKEAAKLLAGV